MLIPISGLIRGIAHYALYKSTYLLTLITQPLCPQHSRYVYNTEQGTRDRAL